MFIHGCPQQFPPCVVKLTQLLFHYVLFFVCECSVDVRVPAWSAARIHLHYTACAVIVLIKIVTPHLTCVSDLLVTYDAV